MARKKKAAAAAAKPCLKPCLKTSPSHSLTRAQVEARNNSPSSTTKAAAAAASSEPSSSDDASSNRSASASGPNASSVLARSSWKATRLKLAAVRAFQEHVKKEVKGPSKSTSGRKYSEEAVNSLLSEMQNDLQNILTSSSSAATPAASLRDTSVASFEEHERQLLESLENAESYLTMKEKWVEEQKSPPSEGAAGTTKTKNAKFKAAVNAVMFVGATKSKVRFSTRTVREFNRSSSFWDHEYWDPEDENEEALSTITNASTSLNSSAASILKESLMNEWESRVSVMPQEADLERACLKLVIIWVETGHFPKTGSKKWERKFSKLSPADMIYHRVHRYPAVALRKLAGLCQRPPTFFLDDTKRQEVALMYLYDALAMWENGEVDDIHEVIMECREEIENMSKEDQKQKERGKKKQKWSAFVGKIETGVKNLFKPLMKPKPKK